ncbi:MAG: hypothetical protein JST87_20155 [Bacteroidetes bacterium]|nr:hypothetical protein [Bacteroidota bacterium]MBS1933597.1 hypothetical protein [Bacteroidota bacterium]
MKSKEQLKAELYKLIDSIDDEELLNSLNEDILPAIIENHSRPFSDEDHDIHDHEIIGLNAALEKPDTQEPVSPEEFKKMAEKWANKE